MVYLWRAVDAEGEVLDVLVQSRRNKRAALKLMRPQSVILESQDVVSAVDGATIEPRIRINQHDDENTRSKGSRALDPPKDFSHCMQQPTTLSTYNAISPQQEPTEPFARRR
jgi:transposase-like protein